MRRFSYALAALLVAGCGRSALYDPATPEDALVEAPALIDFGEALPGTVVRKELTLENVSQTDAKGLSVTMGDPLPAERPAAFDVGGAPPKIAWGKQVKVQLTFKPSLPPGTHRARVRVSWTGGTRNVELRARSGDPCKPEQCPPPKDACHAAARCQAGSCTYDVKVGAACDDANLCTLSDRCGQDGACRGTAAVCEQPPPQRCVTAQTLRTFVSPGLCAQGVCGYAPKDVTCEFGCVNDKCFDPCEGVTCNAPPGFCYQSEGRCVAGKCQYSLADGKACDDGNPCTVGDVCGAALCKGQPMVCNTPPAGRCLDPDNSEFYEEKGVCNAGTCEYAKRNEFCSIACLRGRCAQSCSTSLAAGSGQSGAQDGNALTARLSDPYGMALDSAGHLFINDTSNARIRQLFNGQLTTVPGATGLSGTHDVAVDGAGGLLVAASGRIIRIVNGSQAVVAGSTVTGFADGPTGSALFGGEVSVVGTTGGDIFVADADNQRVRRISGGVVSTYAGLGTAGRNDGPNLFASFNHPHELVLYKGAVLVADTSNGLLRSISPTTTTTLAGSSVGYLDGAPLSARFHNPLDVAVDPEGAFYLADTDNHCIRRISPTRVTTFAGMCTTAGYREGPAASAQFKSPAGITVSADGVFYVADTNNHRVRQITCVP